MRKRAVAIIMAVLWIVPALAGCVVVEIGQEGTLTGNVDFNPGDDVAQIWDSQAVPFLEEQAVPLTQLLAEADGDFHSLAEAYGSYSMGTSGELSYTVSGFGRVAEVNRDSQAGFLLLELDGGSGEVAVKIQIGTVYKGTAVRDSLDFISFDDYTNQVEWAQISKSIHELIDEQVVQAADPDSLVGQNIEFLGCFTVDGQDEVLITPVTLNVQ